MRPISRSLRMLNVASFESRDSSSQPVITIAALSSNFSLSIGSTEYGDMADDMISCVECVSQIRRRCASSPSLAQPLRARACSHVCVADKSLGLLRPFVSSSSDDSLVAFELDDGELCT